MTARLLTIGGSEIAAACGVDPYVSALTLSARKLGMIPAQEETEAMRLGKRLEPFVVGLAQEAGYEWLPAPDVTLHDPRRKWAAGRPDGFSAVESVRAIAEVKTVGAFQFNRAWDESAPLHYIAQANWYMHLTGLDRAVFFVLVGGQRFLTYEVFRDDKAISLMLKTGQAFVNLVRRGKLAQADGSDDAHATVRLLHPEHAPGKKHRATGDVWEALKEARALHQQMAECKRQYEERCQWVQTAMKDAEVLISPYDEEVARFKTVQSSRVDTKALRAAHPEVASEFTNVTTTRRFTLL